MALSHRNCTDAKFCVSTETATAIETHKRET